MDIVYFKNYLLSDIGVFCIQLCYHKRKSRQIYSRCADSRTTIDFHYMYECVHICVRICVNVFRKSSRLVYVCKKSVVDMTLYSRRR